MTSLGLSSPDGNVRIDAHLDCPHDDLWSAITDANRLSEWIGGAAFIEPRVGGAVLFDIPDAGVVASGVVRAFEPPKPGNSVAMVEHTFVEADRPELTSICRWSAVKNHDGGSDLYFTHDGLGEADREKLAAAWASRLGGAVALPSASRRALRSEEARSLLAAARTIVIVDFIGPEVPVTLVEAGFDVTAKVGPKPDDWASCAAKDGELVTTRLSSPPTATDLLHLDWTLGFEQFVEVANELGAETFWYHSARTLPPAPADNRGCWVPAAQSERQRQVVEALVMNYVDDHYIADIARDLIRQAT